ncbi:MAG TPA: two-component sensor histidine kinase [Cyanobacteria bacterium UBA11372]|nr:two-component sensor histidine kinase [Cyanobacteria bacterium UBA11372]
MAGSTGISILAVREVLSVRSEQRGKNLLVQEVQEFRQLLKQCHNSSCNASYLFDTFLDRNIPVEGEFILTLIEGKIYKSSPVALPETLRMNGKPIEHWAQLTQPEKGEKVTPTDTLRYMAEPVIIGGKKRGVFVVLHSTSFEVEKVNEVNYVMILVTSAILFVTAFVTWAVAGRVLKPLRSLTATAHSITESNVSQRIFVEGYDEIAELAMTFNEMLDRIEAAFTSQRNFINDAGHELRTPITIIRGHLELLEYDPESLDETLVIVNDELDRMNRLVNDLLLLAKAERPDFLSLETVDFSTFIQELLAKLKALGERHWQLELNSLTRSHAQPGNLTRSHAQPGNENIQPGNENILADKQRLTQALMNLAQNAVEHTTVNDTITLGADLTKSQIRFWVRDTGEGIPLEDQQRIFARFARVAKTRRRSEGYGLGLAIVRAIAEAHGGKVELQSQPGKGSTFTLILPVEPHFGAAVNGESLK